MRRLMPYTVAVIVLFAVIISVQSCKKDVIYPDICYQRDIQPIFVTNCTTSGCHNPQDHTKGYDFTTYEGIMEGIKPGSLGGSEIWEVINETGDDKMPPNGDLTAEQKDKIKKWILMGAPHTTNCPSPCDTSEYRYSGGVKDILDNNCRGCHNDNFQSGGVNLQNYADIVPALTNSPSYLLGVVRHDAGYIAMPYNAPKLSDCEITVLEKWIAAGAPNN